MGVNIVGGPSWNWTGWQNLFDLGVSHGWEPAGTIPMRLEGATILPEDDPVAIEKWPGTYFSNDLQEVTREDAENWADALERGLAAQGQNPHPKELDFIRYLRRGHGFLIG